MISISKFRPTANPKTSFNRSLHFVPTRVNFRMVVYESISCPFCGQSFELAIDTSSASQRFTTDCEICCRPFEVIAECEPGEITNLEVI
jgi:Cysteine-rich CPXCG